MSETDEKKGFWARFKSGIVIAGSILTLLALFFGGFQFMDSTYAKGEQVVFLNHKVDVKILDDRVNKLQDRKWYLEDVLAKIDHQSERARDIKKQLRELDMEISRLNSELAVVIKEYKAAEEELHR